MYIFFFIYIFFCFVTCNTCPTASTSMYALPVTLVRLPHNSYYLLYKKTHLIQPFNLQKYRLLTKDFCCSFFEKEIWPLMWSNFYLNFTFPKLAVVCFVLFCFVIYQFQIWKTNTNLLREGFKQKRPPPRPIHLYQY